MMAVSGHHLLSRRGPSRRSMMIRATFYDKCNLDDSEDSPTKQDGGAPIQDEMELECGFLWARPQFMIVPQDIDACLNRLLKNSCGY
jgi:hypothetical protein